MKLLMGDTVRIKGTTDTGTVHAFAARGYKSTFVVVWWLLSGAKETVDADRLETVKGHTR